MKKLFAFLFLATATCNYAQITLENTYPTGTATKDYLRLVKLSSSGYKYITNNADSITLYNLNHTVFKNISIPVLPGGLQNPTAINIWYISEELFNTNPSDVEYFLQYVDSSYISHVRVYDEVGNILFSKDSTISMAFATYGNENFITYTPAGVKMILWQYPSYGNASYVYSLPGTLPCHDCANGITAGLANPNGISQDGKISNYPNPAQEQTTIEYSLPQGVTKGDIVFYNITGQEIKRFKITDAFHNIIISTTDLEAGTYYYQMQASNGFTAGKKMIVIK